MKDDLANLMHRMKLRRLVLRRDLQTVSATTHSRTLRDHVQSTPVVIRGKKFELWALQFKTRRIGKQRSKPRFLRQADGRQRTLDAKALVLSNRRTLDCILQLPGARNRFRQI